MTRETNVKNANILSALLQFLQTPQGARVLQGGLGGLGLGGLLGLLLGGNTRSTLLGALFGGGAGALGTHFYNGGNWRDLWPAQPASPASPPAGPTNAATQVKAPAIPAGTGQAGIVGRSGISSAAPVGPPAPLPASPTFNNEAGQRVMDRLANKAFTNDYKTAPIFLADRQRISRTFTPYRSAASAPMLYIGQKGKPVDMRYSTRFYSSQLLDGRNWALPFTKSWTPTWMNTITGQSQDHAIRPPERVSGPAGLFVPKINGVLDGATPQTRRWADLVPMDYNQPASPAMPTSFRQEPSSLIDALRGNARPNVDRMATLGNQLDV